MQQHTAAITSATSATSATVSPASGSVSPSASASWPRAGRWAAALLTLALAACGGGGGGNDNVLPLLLPAQTPTSPATPSTPSTPSSPSTPAEPSVPSVPSTPEPLAIGGTVSGLKGGGLVLVNNGGDALAVSADGAFTFATALPQGAAYAVSVRSQPGGPSQVCTVNAGSGTVADAAVTSVKVLCATQAYTVGGTVNGLAGSGLVLQNNAADDLPLTADGAFVFPTAVASGAAYAVTVKTQPGAPVQLCSVAQGGGTVDAGNVASVQVTCATQTRAVSVKVSGLDGQGLVLQNNAGDDLAVSADGTLQFAARVPEGAAYAVTVKAQPRMYTQTCTVSQGSGTAGTADIGDVSVACVTPVTQSVYVSSQVSSGITWIQLYSGADLSPQSGAFLLPDDLISMAADPKGRVVFAGSANGRGYVIANNGGNSSATSMVVAATGPVMLGAHPNGQYLYVAASGIGSVSTYVVNPAAPAAAPSALQTQPVGFSNASAWPLAVDPLGRFVFVGVGSLGLTTLPIQANGTLGTPVINVTSNVVSIAVHPSGAYLYTLSADNYLRTYSIPPSTGALVQTRAELAGFFGATPASLAIDGRGRILTLVDPAGGLQYARAITDTATGALGLAFVQTTPGAIANVFDPSREGVNYVLGAMTLSRNTIDTAARTYTNLGQESVVTQPKAMGLLSR